MGRIEEPRGARRKLAEWSEIELIECICEGTDAETMSHACGELLRRHDDRAQRTVEAVFRQYRMPPPDVDDVVNVVRLRIVERLPELRDRSAFGSWCRRLATRAALDRIRSLLRRRIFDARSIEDEDGDETAGEERGALRGARLDAAEVELIESIDLRGRLERSLVALAPRERLASGSSTRKA
jgi:RNA polymerase sigma factor (sigma-70 family)